MSNPTVSIVLTAFNRYKQLEKTLESIVIQEYQPAVEIIVVEHGNDGQTKWIAQRAGVKYISVPRDPFPEFQNPARVHNVGIRAATNDVLILQGAEVRYTSRDGIERLVSYVDRDPFAVVSPNVASLRKDGSFDGWFVHPTEGHRVGWIVNFCLAMRRDLVMKVQGFDEGFEGYGYEDDAFMKVLRDNGAKMHFSDVLVQHQWHERYSFGPGFTGLDSPQYAYGVELWRKIDAGEQPPISNYGKDWGRG